jgi:hypothetical protein
MNDKECEDCLLKLEEANEKAAKLSTKKRKALKDSQFC